MDQENVYLDLVKLILKDGSMKGDRTGTGTFSLFGQQMKFDLKKFPLLTTKKMYLKPIFEELMWFIRGQTDSLVLRDNGSKIWDSNADDFFLKGLGRYGDLGPIYGFQWRHFGAKYKDCNDTYYGQGIDQLKNVVRSLLFDKSSRRIVLNAWNPNDIPQMALPPCHVLVQFYVCENVLSAHLYQRSCDMGLGIPFNIASYALLVYLLAWTCGLELGTFTHSMGDCHIYLDHLDAMRKQVNREPKGFPKLKILRGKISPLAYMFNKDREHEVEKRMAYLESFCFEHLKLKDYNSWEGIPMKMSV